MLVASCDYRLVTEQAARAHRGGGWHAAATVRRQEQAYDNLLAEMHRGAPRNDLTVGAQAVDQAGLFLRPPCWRSAAAAAITLRCSKR